MTADLPSVGLAARLEHVEERFSFGFPVSAHDLDSRFFLPCGTFSTSFADSFVIPFLLYPLGFASASFFTYYFLISIKRSVLSVLYALRQIGKTWN